MMLQAHCGFQPTFATVATISNNALKAFWSKRQAFWFMREHPGPGALVTASLRHYPSRRCGGWMQDAFQALLLGKAAQEASTMIYPFEQIQEQANSEMRALTTTSSEEMTNSDVHEATRGHIRSSYSNDGCKALEAK
jgi:hypothetical protein